MLIGLINSVDLWPLNDRTFFCFFHNIKTYSFRCQHAHVSRGEVIGLLGGIFNEEERVLKVGKKCTFGRCRFFASLHPIFSLFVDKWAYMCRSPQQSHATVWAQAYSVRWTQCLRLRPVMCCRLWASVWWAGTTHIPPSTQTLQYGT